MKRIDNKLIPVDPMVKYDREIEGLLADIISVRDYVTEKKAERCHKRKLVTQMCSGAAHRKRRKR